MAKTLPSESYDLSSVRRYSCGSVPLTADIESVFRKKFKVGEVRQGRPSASELRINYQSMFETIYYGFIIHRISI